MRMVGMVLLALVVGVAAAQEGGPAPAPGGGGGAGAGATTTGPGGAGGAGRGEQPGGTRQPPGFEQPGRGQQQQQQQRTFEQRPVFLSGKVVMDDGTPPPESVTIERVCNGQVRPEAYTDSKGRFSFQLGAQNNVLMDASVSSSASGPGFGQRDSFGGGGMGGQSPGGGLGTVDLMGCEIRAALAGFRSEAVVLSRRSMFDNPDIGTIILRRLAGVQATAISFTTLAAPKDAKKFYEKAQKTLQQKNPKHAEAAKDLEKATQQYPQFAAAWNLLGECRLAAKDDEGARDAFQRSLAADGKYVNPYLQLAVLELRASKWADAAELTKRLVSLNPSYAQGHYFNAIANFNLGKMELAEKSARNAMDGDEGKKFPRAFHLLGAIQARQGNFPLAAENFRSYLKAAPMTPEAEQIRRQLTEWEGLGVIQKAEAAPTIKKEKP